MDRSSAELLAKHLIAVDLLLGGMSDVIEHCDADPQVIAMMKDGVFRAVDVLHRGVRKPVTSHYPDLNDDK